MYSVPLGFLGGSDGKEFACNAGGPGSIPGLGRSLEKGMATTRSSILAWRIPWTEEPGGQDWAKTGGQCVYVNSNLIIIPPPTLLSTWTLCWVWDRTVNEHILGFPGGPDGKESPCNAENLGSIPGSGGFPEEGNDYPLHCSCLENPMDRGTWQATGHGVTKESDTTGWLSPSLSSI